MHTVRVVRGLVPVLVAMLTVIFADVAHARLAIVCVDGEPARPPRKVTYPHAGLPRQFVFSDVEGGLEGAVAWATERA